MLGAHAPEIPPKPSRGDLAEHGTRHSSSATSRLSRARNTGTKGEEDGSVEVETGRLEGGEGDESSDRRHRRTGGRGGGGRTYRVFAEAFPRNVAHRTPHVAS